MSSIQNEHHSETPKTVPKALPRLLALPLEIREEIYQYFVQAYIVEDSKDSDTFSEYWWFHNECSFPPLLRTCGQIHDELAPIVYQRVRLAYNINDYDDTHPYEWLRSIGRYVSNIQYCEIRYQTYHYTPTPLSMLLENPDNFDTHFSFYSAICVLYQRGVSLRVLKVSIGRPDLSNRPTSYFSPPRPANDLTSIPWPCSMCTEKESEAMRREFFPEIFYTLRLLKCFNQVERIIISDPEHCRLFGPIFPYYLRGELGFGFERLSTRADEGREFQEMGWTGRGPGFEYWELVNPARRGVERSGAEVAGQNKTWTH